MGKWPPNLVWVKGGFLEEATPNWDLEDEEELTMREAGQRGLFLTETGMCKGPGQGKGRILRKPEFRVAGNGRR